MSSSTTQEVHSDDAESNNHHNNNSTNLPRDALELERQRTLEVRAISAEILDLTESSEVFLKGEPSTPVETSVPPLKESTTNCSQDEKTEEPDYLPSLENEDTKQAKWTTSTVSESSSRSLVKKKQLVYPSETVDRDYSPTNPERTAKQRAKTSSVASSETQLHHHSSVSSHRSLQSQHSKPGVVYAGGSSSRLVGATDGSVTDTQPGRLEVPVDETTVISCLTNTTSLASSTNREGDLPPGTLPTTRAESEMTTVTAYAVSRDDLEDEIRRRILAEAVEAQVRRRSSVMKSYGKAAAAAVTSSPRSRLYWIIISFLVLLLVVAIVVGAVVGTRPKTPTTSNSNSSTNSTDFQDPYGLRDWTPEQLEQFLRLYMGDKGGGFDNPSGMSPTIAAYHKILNDTSRRRMPLDDHMLDYFCLLAIYLSSSSSWEWKNNSGWDQAFSVCDWFGVVCNEEGYVIGLVWPNNNVRGMFIPEYSTFAKRMQYLDFSGNFINFPQFDKALQQFTKLELLNVSNSHIQVQGFDDPRFGNRFQVLKAFDISRNSFTGTLPSSIGNMTSLEYFMAQDNVLTGPVPEQIDQWSHIREIRLDGNNLSGSIPSTICDRSTTLPVNDSQIVVSVDCADVACDCCGCTS